MTDKKRPIEIGVREVKSYAIQGVVASYVGTWVSHIAADILIDQGFTTPEKIPKEALQEAGAKAYQRVQNELILNESDSPDQQRFKEIVARSLAGNGADLSQEVLTECDGDELLLGLQMGIQQTLSKFTSIDFP